MDQARERAIDAYAHQDLHFGQRVDELRPTRDLAVNPLFQTMLTVQDRPRRSPTSALPAVPVAVDWSPARFDLTLNLARQADGSLEGGIVYPVALFDRGTVERLAANLRRTAAASRPTRTPRWTAWSRLTDAERELTVTGWNDTAVTRPDVCLHDLLERQAAATPEATAVIFGTDTLGYAELDGRANRLAAGCASSASAPESLVGVCLERGAELVVALLAVLKAGGAYVPLDPDYPPDRLAFMLADAARPRWSTRARRTWRRLAGTAAVLLPGRRRPRPAADRRARAGDRRRRRRAYVIYTSGSTGRPKGVGQHPPRHRQPARVDAATYGLAAATTGCCRRRRSASTSRSGSSSGRCWPAPALVVAAPGGHRDPALPRAADRRASGVTTLHFVPSMLRAFLDQPRPRAGCALRDRDLQRRGAAGRPARGAFVARLPGARCTTSTGRPRRRST